MVKMRGDEMSWYLTACVETTKLSNHTRHTAKGSSGTAIEKRANASALAHQCKCQFHTSLTWRCHQAPHTGCWQCLPQVCPLAVPSGYGLFWHTLPAVWIQRGGNTVSYPKLE